MKPKVVVEFGTGYGTTAFLTAQALKENVYGQLYTIDDGSWWHETNPPQSDYESFINDKIIEFGLDVNLNFYNKTLDFKSFEPFNDIQKIDILFNDIDCNPEYIVYTLAWLMPKVREDKPCYFFIDGAATYWPAYSMLEMLIKSLNEKNVPKKMLDFVEDKELLYESLRNKVFTLVHFKKDEDSAQNGFSMIKIENKNVEIR
tara:strand:+ start:1033 stop:1638 length:606 start_codon:yes stop_codon:yes gene_type:complete